MMALRLAQSRRSLNRQNPIIRERHGVLAQAVEVASPQIRNVGTLGGNLNLDTLLVLPPGLDCYRAGGNVCYATPGRPESQEPSLARAAGMWR